MAFKAIGEQGHLFFQSLCANRHRNVICHRYVLAPLGPLSPLYNAVFVAVLLFTRNENVIYQFITFSIPRLTDVSSDLL